jgi:hypothetical protein
MVFTYRSRAHLCVHAYVHRRFDYVWLIRPNLGEIRDAVAIVQ